MELIMPELIVTGKTVNEAIESALAQLGLSEEDVTVEVLELPRKKLFRSVPAKVKVMVDSEQKQIKEKPQISEENNKTQQSKPEQKPKGKIEQPKKPKTIEKDETVNDELVPMEIQGNAKLEQAVAYIKQVSELLGVTNISISALKHMETIILKIDGEQTGTLIGHRGETMEALSYLTNLVANKVDDDYIKLGLDVNNYRKKRENNLEILAKRIASKVAKTGKSHTLEPMNPYERRILHSAIGKINGVKSESIGEGVSRRVCILPENMSVKQNDRYAKNNRGQKRAPKHGAPKYGAPKPNNTPARNFADKQNTNSPAKPVAQKRTQTVNDGENLPLYGKIDV